MAQRSRSSGMERTSATGNFKRPSKIRLVNQAILSSCKVQLVIQTASRPQVYRRWFSITLPKPSRPGPVYFTLKFRLSSTDTWRWVNEHSNLRDGALHFQPQTPPGGLEQYLKDFSQDFSVSQVESETPDTQLWSLTSPVKPAEGKASGITETSLGVPRSFSRWFSLVRIWSPWLGPRHGEGKFSPTEDAILSSFLRMDGLNLVLLAVSGVDEVLTVFKPDNDGNVIVQSRNDSPEGGQARVLAAVGATFNTALAAVMYHARKIVAGYDTMSKISREEMQHALEKDVRPQYMENWYDGLTYCTWNALGQDLNEQKIFNALNILKSKGIEGNSVSPFHPKCVSDVNSHQSHYRRQLAEPRPPWPIPVPTGLDRFRCEQARFSQGAEAHSLHVTRSTSEHPARSGMARFTRILGRSFPRRKYREDLQDTKSPQG